MYACQVIEGETVHILLPTMNPVISSSSRHKQLMMVVSSLRENRLHVMSRGHVTGGDDVIGQLLVVRPDRPTEPICALNFPLPGQEQEQEEHGASGTVGGGQVEEEMMIERVLRRKWKMSEKEMFEGEEDGKEVQLRLTDMAELVHDDWQELATQLGVSEADVDDIVSQYSYPSEQV